MTHEYIMALIEEEQCVCEEDEWNPKLWDKVKITFLYDESEDWSEGDSLESRLEAIYNGGSS